MANQLYMEVECPRCGNKQVIFTASSTRVVCEQCGEPLVEPTGGKVKILGKTSKTLS